MEIGIQILYCGSSFWKTECVLQIFIIFSNHLNYSSNVCQWIRKIEWWLLSILVDESSEIHEVDRSGRNDAEVIAVRVQD